MRLLSSELITSKRAKQSFGSFLSLLDLVVQHMVIFNEFPDNHRLICQVHGNNVPLAFETFDALRHLDAFDSSLS